MTTETTEHTSTARPHTAIDAVADAFTDTLIRLNPSFATELGLPGHETEYQDFSPAGHEAFAAAAREALAGLDGLEPADDVDAVTLDAMRERLGLQLEIHESGWDAAELNNIASPAQEIRAIFDLMPTDTAGQWDHIAGRAHNVPAAIDGYIESLRSAKEDGKVSAARQVSIVIEQTTKYAAGDGFFAKLAGERPDGRGPAARGRAVEARRRCCRRAGGLLPARGFPGVRTAARGPGQGRCRPRALRPVPRGRSSAPRWTSRRRTRGVSRNSTA